MHGVKEVESWPTVNRDFMKHNTSKTLEIIIYNWDRVILSRFLQQIAKKCSMTAVLLVYCDSFIKLDIINNLIYC